MSIVDSALVKAHLRLDADSPDGDLVAAYQAAAEEAAIQYLGREVHADQEDADGSEDENAMVANASFTAAVLYAVAAMYHKREDAVADASQFPQESRRFLDPFRVGQGV